MVQHAAVIETSITLEKCGGYSVSDHGCIPFTVMYTTCTVKMQLVPVVEITGCPVDNNYHIRYRPLPDFSMKKTSRRS